MTAEPATITNLPTTTSAPVPFTERDAFELALRRARVYAASTLVPQQYHDNLPNCLIALNMAKRIGADELQVMQNLYIVQGKPGWSAQFLIATFNQSGKFSALRYEWQGAEGSKEWACRAYATERATGERIEGSWVSMKMAELEGWSSKAGSKWKTMPSQMLMYRAAAFLVRTHAPELGMGLQTVEELRDVIDVDVEPAPSKTAAITAALKAKMAAIEEAAPEKHLGPPTFDELVEVVEKVKAKHKPKSEPEDDAAPTYAFVADALNRASTIDELNECRDLIRGVRDPAHRRDLNLIAAEREKALSA